MEPEAALKKLREIYVFDPSRQNVTFTEEFAKLVIMVRDASKRPIEEMALFYLDLWIGMAKEQGIIYNVDNTDKKDLAHAIKIILQRMENILPEYGISDKP